MRLHDQEFGPGKAIQAGSEKVLGNSRKTSAARRWCPSTISKPSLVLSPTTGEGSFLLIRMKVVAAENRFLVFCTSAVAVCRPKAQLSTMHATRATVAG